MRRAFTGRSALRLLLADASTERRVSNTAQWGGTRLRSWAANRGVVARAPGPGTEVQGCGRGFQLAGGLDHLGLLDGTDEVHDRLGCLPVPESSCKEMGLAGDLPAEQPPGARDTPVCQEIT